MAVSESITARLLNGAVDVQFNRQVVAHPLAVLGEGKGYFGTVRIIGRVETVDQVLRARGRP